MTTSINKDRIISCVSFLHIIFTNLSEPHTVAIRFSFVDIHSTRLKFVFGLDIRKQQDKHHHLKYLLLEFSPEWMTAKNKMGVENPSLSQDVTEILRKFQSPNLGWQSYTMDRLFAIKNLCLLNGSLEN